MSIPTSARCSRRAWPAGFGAPLDHHSWWLLKLPTMIVGRRCRRQGTNRPGHPICVAPCREEVDRLLSGGCTVSSGGPDGDDGDVVNNEEDGVDVCHRAELADHGVDVEEEEQGTEDRALWSAAGQTTYFGSGAVEVHLGGAANQEAHHPARDIARKACASK